MKNACPTCKTELTEPYLSVTATGERGALLKWCPSCREQREITMTTATITEKKRSVGYHVTTQAQAERVLSGICMSCEGRKQYRVEGDHCDTGHSWMADCPVCDGTGAPVEHQIAEAKMLMSGICPSCKLPKPKDTSPYLPSTSCLDHLMAHVKKLEARIAILEGKS